MTEAVEKYLKKLHRLEKKNELEVEDLLKIVKNPSKEYIAPLREMVVQYDWLPLNNELIIPFASWVEAICIYLEEGTQGLVKALDKPKKFFSIIFGVIAELPVGEAIPAFLEIAKTFSAGITDEQEALVHNYAYSLCLISHQLKTAKVSEEQRNAFVPILKQLIAYAQTQKNEPMMCSATVCFQAFGDETDIPYLKKLSFTEEYYKNTGKIIAKRITQKYK